MEKLHVVAIQVTRRVSRHLKQLAKNASKAAKKRVLAGAIVTRALEIAFPTTKRAKPEGKK
jgi:hypothetical protein